MQLEDEPPPNLETTIKFVKESASKFGWGDLSEDIVMDMGCGQGLSCSKVIIENFPKVKSIIALDGDPSALQLINFRSPKIQPLLADMLNWDDLRLYEGKIDKIISTHTLQQIIKKQKVFENVYRLLKPEGQAAFLFTSDIGRCHVLERLNSDFIYKAYYRGSPATILYSCKLKLHDYGEMLEKIGFKVIEIAVEEGHFPHEHFGRFENNFHKEVTQTFQVPPALSSEICRLASCIYKRKFFDENSFYASTEMSIYMTKPSDLNLVCSSSY